MIHIQAGTEPANTHVHDTRSTTPKRLLLDTDFNSLIYRNVEP